MSQPFGWQVHETKQLGEYLRDGPSFDELELERPGELTRAVGLDAEVTDP